MRQVMGMVILASVLLASGSNATATTTMSRSVDLASADAVLRWINSYRVNPDLARVPAAIQTLSRLDALKDPESSAVYVGFLAGILGSNPDKADELIANLLSIKAEDQWIVVRAIAYSGAANWKVLLNRYAARMPTRRLMIERYLGGKLPRLNDLAFEKSPTTMDKLKNYSASVGNFFTGKKPADAVRLDGSPEVLDTLWGYYFATASFAPVSRIVRMLPWSKDRNSTDRLTVGSMAKYTLASNAARDPVLLAMLKRQAQYQPDDVKPVLAEVIDAVETMEIARVRKEALAAIDDLKRKGPGGKRDLSVWGQVGQGALAVGCVAAAATGQIELGIPCVVGGALSSAALNYWTKD